jgi:hypothetical protein
MKKLEEQRQFSIRFGDKLLVGNQIIDHLNQQQLFIQSLKKRVQEQHLEIQTLRKN